MTRHLSVRLLALALAVVSTAQPLLALECAVGEGSAGPPVGTTADPVDSSEHAVPGHDLHDHGRHVHEPISVESPDAGPPCDGCVSAETTGHDHGPEGRGLCPNHAMCSVSAASLAPGIQQSFVPLHPATPALYARLTTVERSQEPPPPRSSR